jgi:hypothetical protein
MIAGWIFWRVHKLVVKHRKDIFRLSQGSEVGTLLILTEEI